MSIRFCAIERAHRGLLSSSIMQVLLLGHGGRTVYMGPPTIAPVYFHRALSFALPKNENPADILMDIIGGKLPRDGDPQFKPPSLVGTGGESDQSFIVHTLAPPVHPLPGCLVDWQRTGLGRGVCPTQSDRAARGHDAGSSDADGH